MSNNIRIRTTPNGKDNYVSVKVEQNFDFIEILSLKISQEKAYESFCSDYGALVGRVTINNGFGVPNVKVSIFVPLDDDDKQNPVIRGLYPYETVTDVDGNGTAYNILPKENDTSDPCYTPIGTLPSKNEISDNEDVLYVYKKYYKYTSVTNSAGDYMIFGIPLGAQIVHIDADISDIGFLSQKPYNLIEQGTPAELFISPTQFKKSTKLSSLIQAKTSNNGVNIRPFWGNQDDCQIGINRFDYDLNINFIPTATFIGSLFGDTAKNSVNKNCRPRAKLGVLCEQVTGKGVIEMIRKTFSGGIEKFDILPDDQITDDGTWAYQIPMNLDYVITNEFGDLIPSKDPNIGIATKAEVRFRISMLGEGGRVRARGKHLVPHNPNNPGEIDFNFDSQTKPTSFATMYWDKIYTVKSFIPRVQSFNLLRTNNYLGIKNVEQCTDKNQFPFNRADTFASGFAKAILLIVCLFAYIIGGIACAINTVFCWLCGVRICIIRCVRPFNFICGWIIKLKCTIGDVENYYPVCCGADLESWVDCLIVSLAEELGLYKLDFYNDWVNGTLYFHLFKAKRRKTYARHCDYFNEDKNRFCDTTFLGQTDVDNYSIDCGNTAYYNNIFYYAPMTKSGNIKLYATDLVSLGSIKDCDWQGVPKIINLLDSTTYSVPPVIQLSEEGQPNITGMCTIGTKGPRGCYFEVDCGGIKLINNGMGSMNIRRQCELFVDLLEFSGNNPRLHLSRYEICTDIQSGDDEDKCSDSPAKLLRDIFYLLNFNGTKSVGDSTSPNKISYSYDTNLQTPNLGTSFLYNGNSVLSFGGTDNGVAYNNFRKKTIGNLDDRGRQSWGNSFYFYFGLVGGSTALELFIKRYLLPCIPFLDGDFVISTVVTNTTTNSATNGAIEISLVGGIGPFNILVTNPTIGVVSLPISDPKKWDGTKFTISNLPKGSYNIEVTDSSNATTVKTVEVQGPTPLTCTLSTNRAPSNSTCNNGIVSISVLGGVGTITILLTEPNGNVRTVQLDPTTNSATVSGLGEGLYTLNVNDQDGGTCQKTLTLKSTAKKLEITDLKLTDVECGTFTENEGTMSFNVRGGQANTIAYRIQKIAGPSGADPFDSGWKAVSSDSGGAGDLPPGDYKISLKDNLDIKKGLVNGAYQDIVGQCPQILEITTFNNAPIRIVRFLEFITDTSGIDNKKQCDPSKWSISFKVRKHPLHDGIYRFNRDPQSLSVLIDNFIPVTNLPSLPALSGIGNFSVGTTINFEIPSPTYSITNSVKINVLDVGDCESEDLIISESNIRKPDTRLRFSDTTAGGGSTGNLPYQRNLINCSYPSGWSPGGVIQTVTFTPNPSVGSLPVGTYINLTPTQLTPASGTGAKFAVSIALVGGFGKVQAVTIWNAGQGYLNTDIFRINGSQIGGTNGIHDLTLSVTVDVRDNFTCRYEINWLVEGGIKPYTITPVSTGQTNKLIVTTPPNQNADQWLTVYSTVASRTYTVNVVDANGCNEILLPTGVLQPSPRQIIVN